MPYQSEEREWKCMTPWGFEFRPFAGQKIPGALGRRFVWWALGIRWVHMPPTPLSLFLREKRELEIKEDGENDSHNSGTD